jgi:hypothetical protein
VTRNEKEEFKNIIKNLKHCEALDDENINEAVSHAYRAFKPTQVLIH